MRGRGSLLLLVGIAVLALAATVETLVRDEAVRTGTSGRGHSDEGRRDAAARLRALRISGELLWSDDRCRIRRLLLPQLAQEPGPENRSCSYTVSPDGWVSFGATVERSGGFWFARCRANRIEWGRRDGTRSRILHRFPGCRPAWKPDGGLTYVLRGELRATGPCRRAGRVATCSRVLVSRRDVRSALANKAPWIPATGAGIRHVAWIDDATAAVVVRVEPRRGPADALAVFRGGRALAPPLGPFPPMRGLRVSPLGRFVSVATESGVLVADSRGRLVRSAPEARAVAWSPDERWVALARWGEVVLAERIDLRAQHLIRLELDATELFWR